MSAAIILGVAASAWAQEKTFEGDVTSVDVKAQTFTVKATKPNETLEMAFHLEPHTALVMDGQFIPADELIRGDHVVVTYTPTVEVRTAQRVERVRPPEHARSDMPNATFMGNIARIDVKADTFTVESRDHGKVEEMRFHVSPSSWLTIGGRRVALWQLRHGDTVTVTYEADASQPSRVKTNG